MRTICFIAFLLVSIIFFSQHALAKSFPHGCEVRGFGYSDPYLIVNETGKQTFYLIQNHSNQTIELERVISEDEFMTPALRVKLNESQWAGFASDIAGMHFQCILTDGEHSSKVNCRDYLEVCQYPRVKFALSNMGNYWVSANKSQGQVIKDAAAQGIYLRW